MTRGRKGGSRAERDKQKKEAPFGPDLMQSISRNAISRPECRETCIHIILPKVYISEHVHIHVTYACARTNNTRRVMN